MYIRSGILLVIYNVSRYWGQCNETASFSHRSIMETSHIHIHPHTSTHTQDVSDSAISLEDVCNASMIGDCGVFSYPAD